MEPAMPTSAFGRRLAAAQNGDEESFTELFRSIQPRLLRYLRTMDSRLADDAAAETWLSVVRGLHGFRGDEAGWHAWVFTIARARLVDAQRRAARTPIPADTGALLEDGPGGDDVADRVEEMFSTEAALKLIGLLPQQQAEVIMLRYVAGLDVSQTARVLGRRAGAVRVAGHRGLRRLTDLLADGDEGAATGTRDEAGVTQRARRSVRR
jgi:RNA polymerase sigma-70 factor, ECF subfamily